MMNIDENELGEYTLRHLRDVFALDDLLAKVEDAIERINESQDEPLDYIDKKFVKYHMVIERMKEVQS